MAACGQATNKPQPAKPFQETFGIEKLRSCDKVLDGDLFNKVTSEQGETQREFYLARFFSMSEDEAYSAYQEAVKKQGSGNVSANFIVKMVPMKVGAGGGGSFTKEQFLTEYRRAKSVFSQSVNLDLFSETSSFYSTHVRDEASVKAWSACIEALKQDPLDPVFYAVVERKDARTALLHLTYSGGRFSSLVPNLNIQIVGAKALESTDLSMPLGQKTFGISIEAEETKIAINGSGANGQVGFSQLLKLPAAPESIDRLRCQIYSTAWYAAGVVSAVRFDLFKRTEWTTAPQITGDGKYLGNGDCWIILDGVRAFEMEGVE